MKAIKIKKSLIPTISFFVIASLAVVLANRYFSQDYILSLVSHAGSWGILILIFCFWLTNIFAPLSGSPLLFVGFFAYGQATVFYASVAAVLSAISNFWISRIWGRRLVYKLAGHYELDRLDRLVENYGVSSLFICRLFLKDFHDLISYLFGLSNINFQKYILITLFGMIPSTVIWYLISLRVDNPFTFTLLSWGTAWLSLTVYFFWLKYQNRSKSSTSPKQ